MVPSTARRSFTVRGVPPGENTNLVRNEHPTKASARKRRDQARYMRALHALDLPRPITSGVLHITVTLTFETRRHRDIDNWYRQTFKPLLDAAVGPLWNGTGKNRRPANRTMYVDGARLVGGWLEDDSPEHVEATLRFSPTPGPASTCVVLEWDEATQEPAATARRASPPPSS
jgi:hypothetical protein